MSDAIAGVVLAAGEGSRFGMPKALVEYGGSLLVERAARVLAAGGCTTVLVVLGAADDEVRARAALDDVRAVSNPDWRSGMGSSVRIGLDELRSTSAVGALVLPVDMPGVSAEAVRRVTAHASPSTLTAASYGGRRSHPVLLGRAHWAGAAATATGDVGAREYLRTRTVTMVDCGDIADGRDIDRPEDLRPG